MGSESSKSKSNSLKSDSESSNTGDENGNLERMNCLKENENTIINRVWIAKKSISLNNRNIGFILARFFKYPSIDKINLIKPKINLVKPKKNLFNIKYEFNSKFKHWAIILELSNESFVNIQFGRNGFSLEEFNKTNIEGENVFNSIVFTWGEDSCPFSLCYLGNADYKYDDLKKILKEEKNKEAKKFKENGKTYYNAISRNCQHFVCDIERILFGYIKLWHSFDYYLEEFYNHFFPYIDLNKLKTEYKRKLHNENEKLFKLNVKEIQKIEFKKDLPNEKIKELKKYFEKLKKKIEKLFCLKYEDYLK